MQHQGDHPVADEYRALAKEFEERLNTRREALETTGEVAHAWESENRTPLRSHPG